MKKKSSTPRSRIKNAIRRVWLRSRERAAALKLTGYCCSECGAKQSTAKGKEVKMQVHHDPEINWDGIIDLIESRVLQVPQKPLCVGCHDKVHSKGEVINE